MRRTAMAGVVAAEGGSAAGLGDMLRGAEERHDDAGKLHSDSGPARTVYNEHGDVEQEEWWLHGRRHREDGAAIIEYAPDGEIVAAAYWLDHKVVTEQDLPGHDLLSEPLRIHGFWRERNRELISGVHSSRISLNEELRRRQLEGKLISFLWQGRGPNPEIAQHIGILQLSQLAWGGITIDNEEVCGADAENPRWGLGWVTVRELAEDEGVYRLGEELQEVNF